LAGIGFFLLLLYGVVILIFRYAYGVELPNPFTWLGIGWFPIALVTISIGSALMIWSGFWMRLFDVDVNGLVWALLGAVSSVLVVRKDDALSGDWTKKRR